MLTFYTVEIKRSSLRDTGFIYNETSIEREYEVHKKRIQERKKTRLYDKRKWKRKKKYHEKHYKLEGSRPKDVRFSNQQRIRRMFRNS